MLTGARRLHRRYSFSGTGRIMSFTNLSAFLHSLELERQQLLDRR